MKTPSLNSGISDLARGLGKLLNKGDWTFWYGDTIWYHLTAPLENGKSAWVAGEIICFAKSGPWVRFTVTGDDNLLSDNDQAYLRDIFEHLYLAPVRREQEEKAAREVIEREARTKGRIAEFEKLGREKL